MATFIAVLIALWLATFAVWRLLIGARASADRDRLKSRLRAEPAPKYKKAAKEAPALVREDDSERDLMISRLLERLKLNERLELLIEQAGLEWKVARLIHACLVAFLAGFAAVWFAAPGYFRPLALVTGPSAGSLPALYLYRKRRARLKRFEEQFPEALEFVARSMRAGHAFSVSLEMIHQEFPDPVAGEFRQTFEEQNLGLPLEEVFWKLARRVPSLDVHFFVSAVLLQKRTGGNLAELLDKLAYLIRERFKLRGRIRAISAHGRMTGTVLSLIPATVALLMCYINPSYVRFFIDEELGRIMAGASVGLQVLGFIIIKRIVAIEV